LIILSLKLQKLLLMLLLLQLNFLFKVKSIADSHLFPQLVFSWRFHNSNWIFVYLWCVLDSQCFFLLWVFLVWLHQAVFTGKYNKWIRMAYILFWNHVFSIYSQLFFLLNFCPRVKAFYMHALQLQFWKLFSFLVNSLKILVLDAGLLRILVMLEIKIFLDLFVLFLILEWIVITYFS
jgi:hypothetical protein